MLRLTRATVAKTCIDPGKWGFEAGNPRIRHQGSVPIKAVPRINPPTPMHLGGRRFSLRAAPGDSPPAGDHSRLSSRLQTGRGGTVVSTVLSVSLVPRSSWPCFLLSRATVILFVKRSLPKTQEMPFHTGKTGVYSISTRSLAYGCFWRVLGRKGVTDTRQIRPARGAGQRRRFARRRRQPWRLPGGCLVAFVLAILPKQTAAFAFAALRRRLQQLLGEC